MTGPYKEDGAGTLWVPNNEEDTQKSNKVRKSLEEAIKSENYEKPWLGSYNTGAFELEEMYVDAHNEPELTINGIIEDVFIGLNIPIKNNKEMQKIAEQINKVVTIDKQSSGLYLKPKDFSEVRTRKADPQGRINLGKDYADKEVRVVVLDE